MMSRLGPFLFLLCLLVAINVVYLQRAAFREVIGKQDNLLADFLNNAYRSSMELSRKGDGSEEESEEVIEFKNSEEVEPEKKTEFKKTEPEQKELTKRIEFKKTEREEKQQEPVQKHEEPKVEAVAETVHKVAGLSCKAYGGPSDEVAAEMVYWEDIPSDAKFVSPYKNAGPKKKYLTFEPDEGGWNNIRMSMESAVTLAHAMGRTLVMPPAQGMYLLQKNDNKQKNQFSFADFFHFESVAAEHTGVEIISFEKFLKREIMTGNIPSPKTGVAQFPPGNRTNWEGMSRQEAKQFDQYTRHIGVAPKWPFDDCMVGFPAKPDDKTGPVRLMAMLNAVKQTPFNERKMKFFDNPAPVDAPPLERLRERLAHRNNLCVYHKNHQDAPIIHLMGDNASGARLLVHFYAFLFFEDWKQEQWTKRFVRDHLRYVDEIQCAAARVVSAVRKKAKENGDPTGTYDTFHIRRGDFQYKDTRIPAEEIYNNVKDVLVENSTVYIATDERDKSFFEIFRKHYKVYFLDDFMDELKDVNTNYYGMLDQRIASRGRTFIGTYYSTFTGYINRMRGYHSQKDKAEGYEKGNINSYFYVPKRNKLDMREYRPITPAMWAREFPLGWRDIDRGIEDIAVKQS